MPHVLVWAQLPQLVTGQLYVPVVSCLDESDVVNPTSDVATLVWIVKG